MHPHYSVLVLIIFSAFLLFTYADSQAAQGTENHPETSLDSNTRSEWTALVSLLNPVTIANKIQKASFVSHLVGVPSTANPDKVPPEAPSAQASPKTPDSKPELLQRSLESLISEEAGRFIRSFQVVVNTTVALGIAFHNAVESTSSDSVSSSPLLLKNAPKLFAIARDDFRARFPPPATALGHTKRVERVSGTLELFHQFVIRLARNHEIEQDVVECRLARVKPFLHDAGVLIGDVAELHPAAIEALVLNISAVLLPEAILLRSMVILYCLGPYVLGKDTISGWLLKHVSGALRI